MLLSTRGVAALFVAMALAVGCRGATTESTRPAPQPASSGATASSPAAIARARADSARYPYTAADIRFMSAMIGHHAQALAMARLAPSHGASPSVLRLAERIINGQQDEIALMQQWLRDRRQPVPDARSFDMKMRHDGVEHAMLMPGMVSDVQMRQLDEARGEDFDRLFLALMIQHHRGAISMVKDLFAAVGAGQDEIVFKFASDVSVDQSTEIDRMQKMLAAHVLGIPAR